MSKKSEDNEKEWCSLVMTLIQMAKQQRMGEYRSIKKQIELLMSEDEKARNFFNKTLGSIKI